MMDGKLAMKQATGSILGQKERYIVVSHRFSNSIHIWNLDQIAAGTKLNHRELEG